MIYDDHWRFQSEEGDLQVETLMEDVKRLLGTVQNHEKRILALEKQLSALGDNEDTEAQLV